SYVLFSPPSGTLGTECGPGQCLSRPGLVPGHHRLGAIRPSPPPLIPAPQEGTRRPLGTPPLPPPGAGPTARVPVGAHVRIPSVQTAPNQRPFAVTPAVPCRDNHPSPPPRTVRDSAIICSSSATPRSSPSTAATSAPTATPTSSTPWPRG